MVRLKTYRVSVLLIVCLQFFHAYSQNKNLDSLNNELSRAKQDTDKVKILLELTVKVLNSNSEKAMQYVDKALDLSRRSGYIKGEARALQRKAIIYNTYLQKYDLAFENVMKSKSLAEQIGDKYTLARCYDLLGYIYNMKEEFQKAEEAYLLAEKNFIEMKDEQSLPGLYSRLINLTSGLNKFDRAIEYSERALKAMKSTGKTSGIAAMYTQISYVYMKKGDSTNAINASKEAIAISRAKFDTTNLILALTSIAAVLNAHNNYKQGVQYADTALLLSKLHKDMSLQIACTLLKVECYYGLKNFEQAFINLQSYIDLDAAFKKQGNIAKVAELEMKFKQEKLDALAEEEKAKQRIITYAVSVILVLVLILMFFIYRGYQQKKQANHLITEQKRLVEEKQKEILDSIRYAKRIQTALITNEKAMSNNLDRLMDKKNDV